MRRRIAGFMARLPTPGADNGVWGDVLNEFLLVSLNSDGTIKASAIAAKADDSAVVHNTGAENITGTKTFAASPIVPTPTSNGHAATKAYVDSTVASGAPDATASTKGILQLTGDLSGTAASPTVPGLAGKVDKSTFTTKGDILAATGSSTPTRLGVGSNGQILTASSAAATGLAWAPAASPNTHSVVVKSSAYTLTTSDEVVLANAALGSFTLTLPTASGNTNLFAVKKIDSSGNSVNVAASGGQSIDGGSTATVRVQYASISVVSDGSNWVII